MSIKLNFLFISSCLCLGSCSLLVNKLGGKFKGPPQDLFDIVDVKTYQLINDAYSDIKGKKTIDMHTHVVGLGTNNSGALVNPEMQSIFNPIKYLRFSVYKSGSYILDNKKADKQYVERLHSLVKNLPNKAKNLLLAFDKNYSTDGEVQLDLTEFYVPNEYVYNIAKAYPKQFVAAMSINPYRKDALSELEKWANKGLTVLKWLPNSMGIDPSDTKLIPFYKKIIEKNITILTHAGDEKAVDGVEFQKLGNPLLLRLPLDMGVKIIVAHCASLGDNIDLDAQTNIKPRVDNFALFLRLMQEKKYNNNLWGDISAITQHNRFKKYLTKILEHPEIHYRLYNGSDYPLPAINFVIRTSDLCNAGFITKDEKKSLDLIYSYNPLLFDYVLKRTVKHPVTKAKLSRQIFLNSPVAL